MKKVIVICSFLFVTILGCFLGYLYYNYNIEQSELEYYEKNENEEKLRKALNDAEQNRQDLWEANQDEEGRCTQETIKWIEQRYQDEVDLALKLYN